MTKLIKKKRGIALLFLSLLWYFAVQMIADAVRYASNINNWNVLISWIVLYVILAITGTWLTLKLLNARGANNDSEDK